MNLQALAPLATLLLSSCASTTARAVGACPDPADKSNANLMAPGVSFAHDVMPIFQTSCGVAGSTCHGDPSVTAQGRPFLGSFLGGTSAAQVQAGIVGIPSREDPNMALVTAGQPAKSFLWQKVDNLQCTLASECAAGGSTYPNCGASMPSQNPLLDEATLDTIERWIAQGAKN
jgi:hypothetical protein